jgi:hypothetical protein
MSSGDDEARFRELLDPSGLVPPGALTAPDRSSAFTVFSQRGDACLDMAGLRQNALRFFATKVGLSVDKRYGERAPASDAARVIVASDDGLAQGTRLCFGRPTEALDLAVVEEAERRQQSSGMALLAARCPTVWLVTTEGGDDDRVALTLAAIFASVMLGPIVPPSGSAAFGVRTARQRLESRAQPYR